MNQVSAEHLLASLHGGSAADSSLWIAALIRRAAALAAPCPHRTIRDMVVRPLRGLEPDEGLDERVDTVLESLIAHGDLLEVPASVDDRTNLIVYCAPPTIVRISPDDFMLLGIAGEQQSALPDHLEERVRNRGHVRMLHYDAVEDLLAVGFVELPFATWAKQPLAVPANKYVERLSRKLDSTEPAQLSGSVEILDPATSQRYYRGRWTVNTPRQGYFVARRPQRYGSPLWCLVRASGGAIDRLVDLPIDQKMRGCDEAWQFQAALDAGRGTPQVFRVSSGPADMVTISFFSPVPAWAQRRLSALGEMSKPHGTLFAYTIPRRHVESECRALQQSLWMTQENE